MRFCYYLLVAAIAPYPAFRLQDDFIKANLEAGDPYAFRHSDQWKNADFEEKWDIFRNVIPLHKLQANYDNVVQCHPTLLGPENSDKLAILQHGFLSCPGTWWRLIPRLVDEGFRVMLPTLPGHGRVWRHLGPEGMMNNTIMDLTTSGPGTNVSDIDFGVSDAEDDIDDMPTDGKPYETFAETLGHLAIQFKKEHPDGTIAVAGHSLGGAVTARYAIDLPEVVDRVMLMNPAFALTSGWKNFGYSVARRFTDKRQSKGSKCERKRGKNTGGTCQFRFSHVEAMLEFSYSMLCYHWGVLNDKACKVERDENLGRMKQMQVVTTSSEPYVDNGYISRFVGAVQQQHVAQDFARHMYCEWPSELGHSYLSNRDSGPWWHPYVESVTAKFLVTGTNVDIVKVKPTRSCLLSSANVEGERLNMLPAVQHTYSYEIGPDHAIVMFKGHVAKEGHDWGYMHDRFLEILYYKDNFLIVSRRHENHNVRDIYLMRTKDAGERVEKNEAACVKLMLDDVLINIPLDNAIAAPGQARSLHFCSGPFVKKVCSIITCKGGSYNDQLEQALSAMSSD